MRFHSATGIGADLEAACRAVTKQLKDELGSAQIDLLVVFATTTYGASIDRLPVLLHEMLGAKVQVGCNGATLVNGGRSVANRHAVTVLAGRLPGAQIDAVALGNADLPNPDAPPSAWRALLPPTEQPRRGLLILCDPFHCDSRALMTGLDYGWPDLPKIGGVASGSCHPEGNVLFAGRHTHHGGSVVLSLAGDVQLDTVVSQGCRPIGRPGRVTKVDRNRLLTVDHAPVRRFVEEQLSALPHEDIAIAERSPLFLGVVSNPFAASTPSQGDFLVRNILGIDPSSGNMLVGDHLPVGQQVQLHLRDGSSSARDLQQRLNLANAGTARAALLFRCINREGTEHEQFANEARAVPMAGFHCNGEIGPVDGTTHLHNYSAAVALLRPHAAGGRP